MEVQCECGQFRAELKAFPKNTPGRLMCYCDDCQTYLHYLGRNELLDRNGGTEVVPVYPADVDIRCGENVLVCTQLSPTGNLRFSTSCCNTPIANTRAHTPWIGFHRRVFTVQDPDILDEILGPIRSSIMGRFAKGIPPAGTPKTFSLKALMSVLPFMIIGKIMKKATPSPFFTKDGITPVVTPHVLSKVQSQAARNLAGV